MTKEERNKKRFEKVQRYYDEGRGDWWFMPWWKKILYVILMPLFFIWVGFSWCVMKIGRGIYQFGDFMSGYRWNGGDWSEEV